MREAEDESSSEPEMEFADLRQRGDPELLRDVYDRLFLPSILLPEERQSFGLWTRRLATPAPPPPEPYVVGVVAGIDLQNAERRRLAGYLFFERYRKSRALLLSYVGVDPAFRRQGLMRRLMRFGYERAAASVEQAYSGVGDAERHGATADPTRGVFAEIHVPGGIDARHEPMDTLSRVRSFASVGAAMIPIRYIQPALEPGQGFGRNLMLIALSRGDGVAPRVVSRSFLEEFLEEYYRSCGFIDPEQCEEFRDMIASVRRVATGESPPSELLAACAGAIGIVSIE